MSQNKRLKVCLAMGGGVSLGCFSGAALTEALKVLILYGRDHEGNTYSSIEVDGMSGASAGSIALAIMMRCLIDYKSLLNNVTVKNKILESVKELEVNGQKCTVIGDEVTSFRERLEWIIQQTYGIIDDSQKIEPLIALELTQIVQRIIWVDVLDAKLLFNTNDENKKELGDPFGLLSRNGAITTAYNVIFPELKFVDQSNKQVLSNRALMAFTMANLSPIAYGEKRTDQKDVPELVQNLQNATSINNHNEIRIFDFWFNSNTTETKKSDDRYLTIPDDIGRKLNDTNTWAEILASAVASGAFPMGFPPAIITKYKMEYDPGEWPNNEMNECTSPVPDHLNFAYVDGGTFNNEPIKEAFKIGAFIDFQESTIDNSNSTDRLVLFVDPSVPSGNKESQLKSIDPFTEINNGDIKIKPDSKKMIDSALDLVRMVASQGEINEEAKIQEFYKSSMLNEALFEYFKKLDVFKIEQILDTKLLERTYDNLESSLKSRHISIGTRDVGEFIASKYIKLCSARKESNCLSRTTICEMYQVLSNFVNKTNDILDSKGAETALRTIIKKAECDEEIELQNFGSSIFLAISEMALNQFGKDFNAERAGILPVNKALKIETLPGADLAAFAGFASKSAREACFAKGRLDSIVCLEVDHFRKYHHNTMIKSDKIVNSHINGNSDGITKLKDKLSNRYNRYMNELTQTKYLHDININLRPKIVERMSNIINKFIISFKNSNKSKGLLTKIKQWIRMGKIFIWDVMKNENSKVLIDNLFSESVMKEIIHNKKNIAIKIRIVGDVKSVKLNNDKKISTVFHEKYSYFKIYLVMVNKLQKIECNFSEYCYLTSDNFTNKFDLNEINDISEVKNIKQIKQIDISGFKSISANSLLDAFSSNFNKFKYGINPVFEIDRQGNITIDDLSKPLAKSIEPNWKPFVKTV